MATPHIAGAMALLWSAHPELQNQIDASRTVLDNTTQFISSTQCGAAGPPNNVYGWGRVDILAAVDCGDGRYGRDYQGRSFPSQRGQLTVLATEPTQPRLDLSATSTGQILRDDATRRGTVITARKSDGIANPQNITVTSNLGGPPSRTSRHGKVSSSAKSGSGFDGSVRRFLRSGKRRSPFPVLGLTAPSGRRSVASIRNRRCSDANLAATTGMPAVELALRRSGSVPCGARTACAALPLRAFPGLGSTFSPSAVWPLRNLRAGVARRQERIQRSWPGRLRRPAGIS